MAKAKKAASGKKNGSSRKTSGGRNGSGVKDARGGAKADPAREATLNRRSVKDRRLGSERRKKNEPVAVERRALQRRVKVNRRRQIDPTTCERDYSLEEIEFMNALEHYKRASGRMFPTCSEVLEVIRALGYERPAGQAESEQPPDVVVGNAGEPTSQSVMS